MFFSQREGSIFKMDIGINLYSQWPYKDIISAFLENGIDRTFICIEHPQFEDAMVALKAADITVDNFHAPYKGINSIWSEGEEGEKVLSCLLKSVDTCCKHGVKLMVAHVSGGRPMPPISKIGLARYDRFMEYATEKGITIAIESHRFIENVKFMIERYHEAAFCLDTGHEDAFTPGVRHMLMWGDRLVATHISDNEYVCDEDMHMLPFDGHIDFEMTARELAQYGYDGTLMLEIKPGNHEKYTGITINDYYRKAAERARRLADMVEGYKISKNSY